jgi:hypothetical protein
LPGAADEFGGLLHLAEELAGIHQWGITVQRVVEAERACFLHRHGWLDELSVSRVVDARYRDFLSVSA